MKTFSKILLGTSLLAASLLPAAPARANLLEGLGRWNGNGTVFSPEGKVLADFRVELTRTAAGPNKVETRGTVTTTQGQTIPFRSSMTRTSEGLLMETERGKGYAACVEPTVCHSYAVDAAGNGTTTTILLDGAQRLRVLVTELEKGKPVRLTWQTLSQP
jgi:hypothetical protein